MAYLGLTMNAEPKAKWLTALRSDGYQQAKSYLAVLDNVTQKPIGYCCLGVYCDLMQVPFEAASSEEQPERWVKKYHFPDENKETLPDQNWFSQFFTWDETQAPLSEDDKIPLYADITEAVQQLMDELAQMNDSGESFTEIANFIDTNL